MMRQHRRVADDHYRQFVFGWVPSRDARRAESPSTIRPEDRTAADALHADAFAFQVFRSADLRRSDEIAVGFVDDAGEESDVKTAGSRADDGSGNRSQISRPDASAATVCTVRTLSTGRRTPLRIGKSFRRASVPIRKILATCSSRPRRRGTRPWQLEGACGGFPLAARAGDDPASMDLASQSS